MRLDLSSIPEPQRGNLERDLARFRKAGDDTMTISTLEVAVVELARYAALGRHVVHIFTNPDVCGMVDGPAKQAVGLKTDLLRNLRAAVRNLGFQPAAREGSESR